MPSTQSTEPPSPHFRSLTPFNFRGNLLREIAPVRTTLVVSISGTIFISSSSMFGFYMVFIIAVGNICVIKCSFLREIVYELVKYGSVLPQKGINPCFSFSSLNCHHRRIRMQADIAPKSFTEKLLSVYPLKNSEKRVCTAESREGFSHRSISKAAFSPTDVASPPFPSIYHLSFRLLPPCPRGDADVFAERIVF